MQAKVLGGAPLVAFAYAENDKKSFSQMFGMNRHFLLALTPDSLKVVKMSASFSPKSHLDLTPSSVRVANTQPFDWREAGQKVGQGQMLTATLNSGETLALRLTDRWAMLEAQAASFEPICAYWRGLGAG